MKRILIAAFATFAGPALAETGYSDLIAAQGLAGARDTLSAIAAPTPSDRFALGGLLFLSAVEQALQLRYDTGIADTMAMFGNLPLVRLPIPENPAPVPLPPGRLGDLARDLGSDLDAAAETLAGIGDSDDVAVVIDTNDLWFDIDADGRRSPGEGFNDVAGAVLTGGWGEPPAPMTIRFDTADAAWLSAYAHLLDGFVHVTLAVDLESAAARVLDANQAMAEFAAPATAPADPYAMDWTGTIDTLAVIIGAVEGPVDAVHAQATGDAWRAMIADNRVFWRRVATETDNDREWIPNKRQDSVLPIDFPADLGAVWLRVLDDAERLLNGDLLLPYWRIGPGAGLNLARLLQDPPTLDIAGLVQGSVLVPYMEHGRVIDDTSLRQFEALVGGQAGLFVVVLN